MGKIFIYYSLTGNCDLIADIYREKGYDIRKVRVKNTLPNNFVLRMLSGGFKAAIKYKEKLIDFNTDISSYDEVIISSPIWNSRISSPITTVINKLDLENKNLTFILTSGGGNVTKAEETLKKKYPDCKVIGLKEPKLYKEELNKLL